MKKVLKIVGVIIFFFFISLQIWALGVMSHNMIMESNDEVQKGLVKASHQEPELLAIAQELGLRDIERINFYFHEPESGKSCDEEGAGACYFSSRRKIIFKREALDDRLSAKALMAHEYMHDVWNMGKQAGRYDYLNYISTLMIIHYSQDQSFRDKMSWYMTKGRLSAEEMFATACTNSPDETLTQQILDECSRFIDRNKLIIE